MWSELAVTLLLLGAPVKLPEVTNLPSVQEQMGKQVTVVGVLERVELAKGNGEWEGTALVLDDDSRVYVTYAEPPGGWEPLVGQRVKADGLLHPSLSDHEQSLLAPHLRAPGLAKPAPHKLSAVTNQRVRLSGLARDAKGGAVLLVGKTPLYLAGLDRWPQSALGKQVVVGGTVVNRAFLPEATRTAKGEWSQGAQGTQLVIEAPTWRLPRGPTK